VLLPPTSGASFSALTVGQTEKPRSALCAAGLPRRRHRHQLRWRPCRAARLASQGAAEPADPRVGQVGGGPPLARPVRVTHRTGQWLQVISTRGRSCIPRP